MATQINPELSQLNIRDIQILGELPFHSSMRKLAKALGLEAQHMSKVLKNIEEKLSAQLVNRSVKGIAITPEGLRYSKMCKEILDSILRVQENFEQAEENKSQILVLASRVFLNSILSGVYAQLIENQFTNSRIRLIDGSPDKKEEWAKRGLVDLIVSIDKLTLSADWTNIHVGEIEWAFYARKNHPSARAHMSLGEFLQNKILVHSFINGDRLIEGDNVMGIKIRSKSKSLSVETAFAAINVITNSNQIGLLPIPLVKQLEIQDRLLRIHIDGQNRLQQKVFLSCHSDRVAQKFFRSLAEAIAKNLGS